MSAAKTSALRRSTARSLAPARAPSSLRFLAGLADPAAAVEPEDILADLKKWDSYDGLYDLRIEEGYRGEVQEKTVGGGIRSEGWEKAIRAGVAGLFVKPLEG